MFGMMVHYTLGRIWVIFIGLGYRLKSSLQEENIVAKVAGATSSEG